MTTQKPTGIACSDLLSGVEFPAFPFANNNWYGLVFNRDCHGRGGVPKDVFEAMVDAANVDCDDHLLFVPAVLPLDGAPPFSERKFRTWDQYLALLSDSGYCPEYFVVNPQGSMLFWVDPDASVVGADRNIVEIAVRTLGGLQEVIRRSADEFGVEVGDPESDVAAYIRALAHLEPEKPAAENN